MQAFIAEKSMIQQGLLLLFPLERKTIHDILFHFSYITNFKFFNFLGTSPYDKSWQASQMH